MRPGLKRRRQQPLRACFRSRRRQHFALRSGSKSLRASGRSRLWCIPLQPGSEPLCAVALLIASCLEHACEPKTAELRGRRDEPTGIDLMLKAIREYQSCLIGQLRQLSRTELQALYDAAAEATDCVAELARHGANPVTEVLAGASAVEEWMHFPSGDVIDPQTHSQFYYHAHAAEERMENEHGHFHTFVRPRLIDRGRSLEDAAGNDENVCSHLVGISTDASGRLIRLFTTNRWVTGEAWRDADAAISLLDHFDITTDRPSRELNRWISAVVRLFRPQIETLIRTRDETVAQFRHAHPDSNVLEDRELQITSELPVDFLDQIRAIESALA